MATLEKIRSKAGVLVSAVIGLALLAFILTDFLNSRKSVFFSSSNTVGIINGKKIDYQQFEEVVNNLINVYKIRSGNSSPDDKTMEGIRNEAWQKLVNKYVLDREYSKLGLAVSPDELSDYTIGANTDPIFRRVFTDPQTGLYNRERMLGFMKYTNQNPNSPEMTFRLYVEDLITNDHLNSKYVTLIKQGLGVPTFMAKADYNDINHKVDFNFLVKRYTDVSDSGITATHEEMEKYYKSHKYLYHQSASRDMEYVTFDIKPSDKDRTETLDDITKLKPDFESTSDVEQYVNENSDVPYNDVAYAKDELPDSLGNILFDAKVGTVYGPYFDGTNYKLARLYKVVYVPDSVKARHILIMPKGKTQEAMDQAKALADSILKIIKTNKHADFKILAMKYSDDKGSAIKGGELGWFKEGMMVKPFNDAAFSAKKGETVLVQSDYGFHVLQVEDRSKEVKKVKVAFIIRKLNYSQQTYNDIYAKVMKFASESQTYPDFLKSIKKYNLTKKVASNLTESDRSIPGIESPRDLLRWVFSAKKGQISDPKSNQDQFVIAALTQVREKGTAPFDQVKSDVEVQVLKKLKIAKIDNIINKAKSGVTSIQDLGLKLNLPVESASQISFSSFSIPNYGIEPKVIAFASVFPKDKISGPVDGNNGVYVIYVINVQNSTTKDFSDSKRKMDYLIEQRANYESYNALKKLADIKDQRIKFF